MSTWKQMSNHRDSHSYEKVKPFKYLRSLLTNQYSISEEIKCSLEVGCECWYSVRTLLSKNWELEDIRR